MKITSETIPLIEKALGFTLYDWQKSYLLGEPHEIPPGRAVGKTVAYIVKFLLTSKEPIELEIIGRYQDHVGSHYKHWFKGEVKYIHDKFTDVGLTTQLVTKNKPKQSISISVDADTNKLQLKLRAIAKHAESLADELDAIDNEWQCDCGSIKFVDSYSDKFIKRECKKCSEQYAIPSDDLPTCLEGSD